MTSFEITESLPRELPSDAPFAAWLVIPARDAQEIRDYVYRAVDSTLDVVTPVGTFGLRISALVAATRVGAKEGVHVDSPQKGVLALLCFDPRQKGPLVYPLPSVFETARKAGLLTRAQQGILASNDRAPAQRYQVLLQEWADFAKATYVMPQRPRLMDALLALYVLPGTHLYAALEPPRFFDRAQRIQLRKLGESLPGQCQILLPRSHESRLALELRNCPLSQLAGDWNGARTWTSPELEGPVQRLAATAAQQHEELDLTLQLSMEPKAARRVVSEMLRALDGIAAGPAARK
ncbi:hypothetical protein [Pyxidicoccus xibeiensis]|uniref:hypothetical protein n=1 Tax=Pyxidicoccus xibeiensis TaxID=2906759 RepID=UPI0020A82F52|nr:hypothetical protein [Pyxidicoccus xibeiensis]MCP3139021.1 hypothetical protein [Pyxidicoccus xibeiensis]